MPDIALKGFANLKYFPHVTNTKAAYVVAAQGVALIGARSCSPADTKTPYKIPGDDGYYKTGSDWTDTKLTIVVNEMELANIAAFSGSTYADGVLSEFEPDQAPHVALSYSALLSNGGYRLYQYFDAQLQSIKADHKTKTENGQDVNTYTLEFLCVGRLLDRRVRATKDVAAGAAITWLDTILGMVKYSVTYAGGVGATGDAPVRADLCAGETFITADNPFTLTGKTFLGWSDGAGHTYDEGHAVTMGAADLTLTATWSA
jgi:phi13 family phage major tail protein